MSNKKLRTLAALTSALLVVNAGTGTFAASADSSAGFNSVIKTPETDNVSYISGEYATLPQIEGEEEYGIRIAKSPAKTEYLIGEELDISDIRISGYCNTRNEDGKLLTIHDFLDKDLQAMIDNGTVEINTDEFYNSRRSGVRSIYIYYGNAETKFDVFVENPDEYSSLKWDVMPEKTEYLFGEELDFTGAKVSGSYTDGMICSDIFNADLQSLIDSGKIEVEATDFYNNATTGTRTIYLYYYDAEIEFDVEVTNPHEYYSLNICKPPTKTVYQLGEELDITGTKIQGTYGNGLLVGDIFPTDLAPYLENGMITLDDSEFNNTKAGTYTIYIHYGTATASFDVTVTDEAVVEENTIPKEFFVYVGTYGDGLPQFRYLYPKSDGSYNADKVIWENAPTDIAYGDIFVADGEINLTKVYPAADNPVYAHTYHYTIAEDAVLNSLGKCIDIMEKKNLTVTSKTYDGSSHWSIRYKDDTDKEYYYGLSVLASNLEVDPLDCEVGDVYTFALYNDYMVIPLSEHNIEENAVMTVEITEIDGDTLFVRQSGNSGDLMTLSAKHLDSNIQPTIGMKLEVTYCYILETYPAKFGNIKKVSAISDYTSVAGDANGDGEFTIADMVSVQNNLLGKKTAKLADWRAADLYPDGKIDVYDFIVMRSEFVKNFK